MAPKQKPTPNIYIVVTSTGIDSVFATLDPAQQRIASAKSEGSTAVRVEVQTITGGTVLLDKPASSDASAKTKDLNSNNAPKSAVFVDAADGAAGSKTDVVATPAPAKNKDSAPKPKASAAKDGNATAAAGTPSAAKATKPKEIKPKTDATGDSSATPAKSGSKTVSADDQRTANAKKGTPAELKDLPANVQALLAGTSNALDGQSIVVTGTPPVLGRSNAEQLVKSHGGKLAKTVSGKTNFVVLGNSAGPKKLEEIKALNIETVDEDAFIKKLEAAGASKKRSADEAGVSAGADVGESAKKPKKAKKAKEGKET